MDATLSSTRSGAARQWESSVLAALAGVVPLVVFLRTMAPTVYGLDSAELTTGAYTLGIVHAPGSPTYLLLGHIVAQIPIGDVGYRLNLLAGLSAAVAIHFLYRILRRLTNNPAIALGTSWFFAFSYYLWVSAVAAEIYATHVAFVAAASSYPPRPLHERHGPPRLCAAARAARCRHRRLGARLLRSSPASHLARLRRRDRSLLGSF
jgi:hypothetical protein